jgi:hypothetical protein
MLIVKVIDYLVLRQLEAFNQSCDVNQRTRAGLGTAAETCETRVWYNGRFLQASDIEPPRRSCCQDSLSAAFSSRE